MKRFLLMALLGLSLSTPKAYTQWIVSDPTNFTGNIVNTIREIATALKTAKNTLDGLREVGKLCNDTKGYYDALKKVNNPIGDAYKVEEYILMMGDISKICVTSYKKMLSDKNLRPFEPAAIASGYTKLLEQSGESLKELKSVVKSGMFSMNDREHMWAIDRIYTTLREYHSLVSYYVRKNIPVSYVHAREKDDLAPVRTLYNNTISRYWQARYTMDFTSLYGLLCPTYDEMMPPCSEMTSIAKGVVGLGTLLCTALKVQASIAHVEAIGVLPLSRPLVLGLCIMLFLTLVLGIMNTVLSPVVQGTEKMANQQENNLVELTAKRNKLQGDVYLRDPEMAYLVSNEKFDEEIEEIGVIGPEDTVTIVGMHAERVTHQTKQWVMKMVYDLVELLFHAAGLIIDTLRTLILIVSPIFGPTVFDTAVWDGLAGSLTAWLSRYVSAYLWLPASSILTTLPTKIQILTAQKNIEALSDPGHLPDSGT